MGVVFWLGSVVAGGGLGGGRRAGRRASTVDVGEHCKKFVCVAHCAGRLSNITLGIYRGGSLALSNPVIIMVYLSICVKTIPRTHPGGLACPLLSPAFQRAVQNTADGTRSQTALGQCSWHMPPPASPPALPPSHQQMKSRRSDTAASALTMTTRTADTLGTHLGVRMQSRSPVLR